MKFVGLLVVLVVVVACSLAQPLNSANTQPAVPQPPNLFQLMLMQNMFDNKWLPFMYLGGGIRSLFPLLLWGNM